MNILYICKRRGVECQPERLILVPLLRPCMDHDAKNPPHSDHRDNGPQSRAVHSLLRDVATQSSSAVKLLCNHYKIPHRSQRWHSADHEGRRDFCIVKATIAKCFRLCKHANNSCWWQFLKLSFAWRDHTTIARFFRKEKIPNFCLRAKIKDFLAHQSSLLYFQRHKAIPHFYKQSWNCKMHMHVWLGGKINTFCQIFLLKHWTAILLHVYTQN